MEDRRILLGKIVGLFGVEGWVKLESHTEPRLKIFKYQPWLVKTALGESEVADCRGRAQGKTLVATLPGIANRDQAAALVGAEIYVPRSRLPKPKAGEYYWTDLEGLEVVNLDGVSLGRVSHVIATGANDVLVVREGDRERLLPFVLKQFVHEVDMGNSRITVDWDADF